MNARHTPGPWLHLGVGNIVQQASLTQDDIVDVAAVYGTSDKATAEANAKLVAAAPDLLFCLKVICSHAEGDERLDARLHLEEARAAIAKATGEAA